MNAFQIKQSLYQPGQALRVPEVDTPRIARNNVLMRTLKLSALHSGCL